MNIKDLLLWAEVNFDKNNTTLITEGCKPEKITKVRAFLRATIDRCKIILSNTEKNNKYTEDIKEYIELLSKYGNLSPKNLKDDTK